MTHHRIPHPFAPPRPGGAPLAELVDRHAHLVAVGLANCRAAQALHKEITRRKQAALSTPPQAPLPNDDNDDHYDPQEHRDSDGKWTTGPNASGSLAKPSIAAQVKGSPAKFGYGAKQGLQQQASKMAQGVAQLSDPGPLKDNFSTFLQAQDQSLAMVPHPQFDPLTGEFTGDDTYEQARWRMSEQREIERERLRAPWESFSEAAAEVAAEYGHLKDTTPGPNWVGTAGVMTGETLGYVAPSAIPVVGQVTGPVAAGLASIGDTFNQAYAAYKQQGYSDDQSREMARKVAINTGVATGIIFALPIGRLASLPIPALSQVLLAMGISGAQLSADKLQSLLQARATFNPNLTLTDIAKETGNSFLLGAILSGSLHGAQRINPAELARMRGTPGQGPEAPLTETADTKLTPPPLPPPLLQPLSAAERQALDQDIQAHKPISMDTIVRANITEKFPRPKGYELDASSGRLIYTGLELPRAAGTTQQNTPTQPGKPQPEQASHSSGSDDGLLPSLKGNIPNAVKRIPQGYRVLYSPDGSMTVTSPKGVVVKYNALGFPDFSPFLYHGSDGLAEVRIDLTNDRTKDTATANAKAGFSSTPPGYTWHHNEDTGLMQLVDKDVHDEFSHLGGFSIFKNRKQQ